MRENKGPSINVKNINFINRVEDYEKRNRVLHKTLMSPAAQFMTVNNPKMSFMTTNSEISNADSSPKNSKFKESLSSFVDKEQEIPIYEKDYFTKHVYMMQEKMVDMFKNSDSIPPEEKRMIEKEFHSELKELKHAMKEIKETRKNLFAINNDIHAEIEKITEEIEVFFYNFPHIKRKKKQKPEG